MAAQGQSSRSVLFYARLTLWLICIFPLSAYTCSGATLKPKVIVYPAPAGEKLSTAYQVSVSGQKVPVYMAKVTAKDNIKRFKTVDNSQRTDYYNTAAFA